MIFSFCNLLVGVGNFKEIGISFNYLGFIVTFYGYSNIEDFNLKAN